MENSSNITLNKDVRAFSRSSPSTLSNHQLIWFRKGTKLSISQQMPMVYDHKVQTCVQVLGENPERFIIVSEFERDPWYVSPPAPSLAHN